MKRSSSIIFGCLLLAAAPAIQAQFTYTTNNGAINITGYTGSGGAITIPSTIDSLPVTTIASEAFYEDDITSVTIPASITNIAEDSFEDCVLLTTITVNTGNPVYVSVGGILFNSNKTTLIQYPPHKSGTSYTIPTSVIRVGDSAFEASDYLTAVTIPNNVTSLGNSAFFLTTLSSITIPDSVTNIGGYTFEDCPLLTSINFKGNAPIYGINYGPYSFETHANTTIYYYAGTSGWGSSVDGVGYSFPTVMLNAPNPNGSLQVTINPTGAINAGAYWQVDGGIPQPSGETVLGLSVGNHTVSFSQVTGWTTPANQMVSVSANVTATSNGTYVLQAPPQITTTTLPNAANGGDYSQQLSAINGQLPYTWSIHSGSLPAGVTLSTIGLISGTPVTNGTFSFTVEVTDALSLSATQSLAVTVGSHPNVIIQPTNNEISISAGSNITFSASVTGTGPFTYQWQLNGTNLLNGIITAVAGNGIGGYSGDGGAATNEELNSPAGLAVDATGNLFIADTDNHRIRKVDTNGIISTVAGNGTGGYSGDGGAATNAELYYPEGVAVDAIGNLFIADLYNNRIRKVGTNGIITSVAGNGISGFSGDGGAANNAELNWPGGVTVDKMDNIFIGDRYNNRIRKVGTNGIIATVAGNGMQGYSGDWGAATNAGLFDPIGMTLDAAGDLVIADWGNHRIRKVDLYGIITTVAGNGIYGYSGDGGAATNAELDYPADVVMDATSNLFIADSFNHRIRKVDPHEIITTVAGGGSNYPGDGGMATNAELFYTEGMAMDIAGNLLVVDGGFNRIHKVVLSGPTHVLNDVGASNAGAYDVVVSSPYGSVTSSIVNLTITAPLQVATVSLSNDTNGVAYSQQLSAINGKPPYNWSIYSGSLPSGLALATNGMISGTPTNNGSFNFTVEVTDALSEIATQALQLTVVTRPSQAIPALLSAPSSGSSYYGMYSPNATAAAFTLTNSYYVSTIEVTLYTPGTNFNTYDFTLQSSLTNPLTVFASQNLTAAVGVSTQVMNVNMTLPAGTYYLTSIVPGYFGTAVTPGNVDGWSMSTGYYIQTGGTIENGVWAVSTPPTFSTGGVYVAPAFTLNAAIQLGMNSVQPISSTSFNLVLYSFPGLNYDIETSTNLVDWTTITNFVSTNSPLYLSIPRENGVKQQFYRAVLP